MRWLAALVLAAAAAQASAWPERPVTVLVAAPEAEALARLVAPAMEPALGQALVIQRRARGAAAEVAGAAPDGYTALLLDSGRTLQAAAGLAPVSMVAATPFVILAGRHAGFGSLEGLLEVARHNPGQLVYATAGRGSAQHLAAELFFSMAGVRLKHMPYPDTAHAVAATATNDAQVLVETAAPVLVYVRTHSLNALGVSSGVRHPGLPGVPTAAQAGVAGYRAGLWYALAVPAGTPAAAIDGLREALHAALAQEQVRRGLERAALAPAPGTGAALAAHMRAEIARWRAVRAQAGIDE